MHKRLVATLVLAMAFAVSVAAISIAAKPTVVRAGNLILKINGGVTPKALPRNELAPITLRVSGNISTANGSQPPVAKMVKADFDKHGTINAKGIPVCKRGKLEARDTQRAKAACPKSIVGSGSTVVRVEFPDSRPFTAKGPLVLFNGGARGGRTMLYIHAYVAVPVPTALITPVKITKVRKGRYGTRATARVPVIAGGSGAVTRFALKAHRLFKYRGKRQSYLLARCPTGRLFAHANISFSDGSRLAGNVIRPCTPKR